MLLFLSSTDRYFYSLLIRIFEISPFSFLRILCDREEGGVFLRNRNCNKGKGGVVIAFGVGMIVSYLCPSGFVIVLLSIALVLLALICR